MEKERYDGYNRDKTEPSDLYEDLPKEVVDILMETHPLMGKNEQQDGATIYRRRTRQNNEQTQVSQDTTSIDWSGAAGEETVIGRKFDWTSLYGKLEERNLSIHFNGRGFTFNSCRFYN